MPPCAEMERKKKLEKQTLEKNKNSQPRREWSAAISGYLTHTFNMVL